MLLEKKREFKSSGKSTSLIIDKSRPSRESISLFQIPTSMSESSLWVIVLPSLVYPSFELDIEQDEIRKALLSKKLNELNDLEFFESFLTPGILE